VFFIQSIVRHNKFRVQYLFNLTKTNVLSVTGKCIRQILNGTGQTDIIQVNIGEMKKSYKFCDLQEKDKWVTTLIEELTKVKQGSSSIEGEDQERLLRDEENQDIINYVSTC
jgi:hypothetical protein